MSQATLHLLCAGAAQGLVKALQPQWLAQAGAPLDVRFGAVGAMKQALLAGSPCDVMVVTEAMVDELIASGALHAADRAPLGRVGTAIAVPASAAALALPDVASAAGLKAALLAAEAIYFPDPQRATAGIHFADVMRRLGIHETLAPRFCIFPNGAAAMRELADHGGPTAIGCTQASEIRYTEGVRLVGELPVGFELRTVYSAALSAKATEPALAGRFITLLTGPASLTLRQAAGFEA